MVNFNGPARSRSPQALVSAADALGCDVAAVRAVVQVEARGKGFDDKGRPLALFEPHVFYRNLFGAKLKQAVAAGLAYANWKPGAYPKDSYPRILRAIAIDEAAALKATSWGLPQILGENFKEAGYSSPAALVQDYTRGEDEQIASMAKFIRSKGLHRHLQKLNWEGFARGYNGPGFKKNAYDSKLARAYARFSGVAGFMQQPDDEGDDGLMGNSCEPEKLGFLAKVRNWLAAGAGFGWVTYLTNWQIAAVLFAALFVIGAASISFVIYFFGADNVRAWVRKQVW